MLLPRFESNAVSFFREMALLAKIAASRIFHVSEALFLLDQNLALSGVIRLADDAFQFHPLH